MNLLNKFIKFIGVLLFLWIVFFGFTKVAFAADPVGNWFSAASLPYLLASHGSFSHEGRISIIGGSAVTGQSKFNVITATPSASGNISNWNTTSFTPTALIFHSVVKKNSHVYILSGREENPGSANAHVPKVFVGNINTNGIVNSWTQLNSLPQGTSIGNAVVVADRIYYAGGFNNSGQQDEIYYADINPDGTSGSWTTSSVSLPEPLSGFGMVEHNNKIIVFGGFNGSVFKDKVYKASVNPDGSISSFTETTPMPDTVYRSAYIKIGSTIISAGGYNGVDFLDEVYYANINPDGTIDSWQQSANNLPQVFGASSAAYANGYIYVTGGFNGAYLDDVYFAPLNISSGVGLSVPYYSQNDNPWGPQEYDHANSLGFSDPDFERWGCAVTSAAMVLNFHGMTELPDGSPLNPGSLNDWLKSNNGYSYGGSGRNTYSWILWPTISKLTRQLFDLGKSSVQLEHRMFREEDGNHLLSEDEVKVEISNDIPLILKVKNSQTDGHFLVAKGFNDNTFFLNDPEFNHPDLTNFNNNYYQVDRFTPTNTDLSYIVVVVNPNVEILVTDPDGNKKGKISGGSEFNEINGTSYGSQEPISNPNLTGTPENLGTGVNEFLFPKPFVGGEYKLLLSSEENTLYTLNISTFQEDGVQTHKKILGSIKTGENDEFILNFSKNSESDIEEVITFDILIADINSLYELGEITNRNYYKLLLAQANVAKKLSKYNFTKKASKVVLKVMQRIIERGEGRYLTENAASILNKDIEALLL